MHRRSLIFPAFWLCVLAYFLVLVREDSSAPAKPGVAAAALEPVPKKASPKDLADHERQTQAQIEGLASLEAKRNLRSEAARRMYDERRQLQFARSTAWSSLVSTNWPAFEALRHEADGSPAGTTHCTICVGNGVMLHCLLCLDSGKCPTCHGTGRRSYDEPCPTCLGAGKCYLCGGSGKMPCLFCDDGTISRKVPPPPMSLPVRCDPVPAPEILVADSTDSGPESAPALEAPTAAQGPHVSEPAPARGQAGFLLTALLFIVAVGLGKIVVLLNEQFNFLTPAPALAADRAGALLAEEPSVGAFFSELRDGPMATAPDHVAGVVADPLQVFFDTAPGHLASLRTLFAEIARAPDEAARQKILLEFLDQVRRLKEGSQMLELRPVWIMACALEGLLRQLSSNASNVTPSVLATAAGAVDLLDALCVRGLNPNLASDPPVRLLAVDDDAVSRLAISFALKKAFNEPDLAPDGEAALALTALQSYDVIFLDVEMPGMDGFEVCRKFRETGLNRTTPVVFVTRHSDFASRAKSSISGGRDLIAKPFLAFEITVKALTLALRTRLMNGVAEAFSTNDVLSGSARGIGSSESEPGGGVVIPRARTTPVEAAIASEAPAAIAAVGEKAESRKQKSDFREEQKAEKEFPISAFPVSTFPPAPAFLTHAPAQLEELRNQLQAAWRAAGPAALKKSLGALYVGVHSLSLEAERAELRAMVRLGAALEGMLKKLLEHTKLCTPSTLTAAGAALDLLEELFHARSNPDLTHPPIRLLVVDDDPIARRAISMALQLVFGRPDSAESGETALTLAAEKPFDLIFLDVLMPGMDGFTTCAKIRETAPNRLTPVVFITSRDDLESRSQAIASGGCGFLPKPVLASEITLTALTFILRARLNKVEPAPASEETACVAIA